MADLTVSADIDAFMGSADNAAARANLGAGVGDMLKSTYDPQDVGFISGATRGGNPGGVVMIDGDNTGGAGGNINTSGGGNGPGGAIDTHSGGGAINSAGGSGGLGGGINTSGGATAAGGSIDTHDGGGSINTRGTGSIELGADGSRTTFNGGATANRTINLPDAGGTVALLSQITITQAQAGDSITPAPDGTYALPTSITIAKGIITAIS